MDRLLIENTLHRLGEENGDLRVSYQQFVGHGVGRRLIAPALQELVYAGLLAITQSKPNGKFKPANLYRLIFLGTMDGPATW
jgi:hypothetical protein